jgi:DNA-damage-inducible protein J
MLYKGVRIMANVNIRVDDAVKKDVEAILSDIGLSLSSATNVFYKQVIKCRGIPFELVSNSDPFFSERNMAILHKSINDYETGKSIPVIKTVAELEAMTGE